MMTVKEKSCDEEPDRKRSKYSEGYAAKDFKLSSVKKVFVLAVTKTVENHHNLSTILENLGLDAIDFGYSADLKMVAIICGKQNASSKHPCPWCDGSAPWTTPSSPTTIGSLWSCYHKWISNGADKSKAMEFGNVIYKPLLTGDNDVLICDIFNIPELHILTGVTGKLVQEFERKAFRTPEEGKDFMNAWLKKKGVRRCVYQGSASFEGNQADKLLKSVDSLEQAVLHETSPEVIIMALPFTQALRLFRKVCVACFGQSLDPNYTTYIQEFMASYRGLGISIPLKVFFIKSMLMDFFHTTIRFIFWRLM